jgi:hypothetical protein
MATRLVAVLLGIGALSLSTVQADHERSNTRGSSIHSSPRKTARTHSSSPHSDKKEKASRENKTQSKSKRRSGSNRDRDRDAAQEQILIVTPPVDLPDREDGPEADVQSDEESSANLMSAASQTDDNGGDQ